MAAHSNTTTAKLEAYGRARGLDGIGILEDGSNSAGVFFVTAMDGKALSRWISLGWSREEALAALDRLASDRPVTPSATGYSFSV